MEEPGKEPLERREYTVTRWMPTVWLVAGILWIAATVLAFAIAGPKTILIPQPDGTYVEAVDEHSRLGEYHGLFCLVVGVLGLFYAATYWDYRVVMDETGVHVRSLLVDRRVAWDEVKWSNVWRKKRVVLGGPRGRALFVAADVLRPRQGLVDELLRRLRQPRFLRIRWAVFVPAMAVGCLGTATAVSATHLPWLVAAGAGAMTGLLLVIVMPGDGRSRAVLAWTICAAVAVIAWGVSGAFDLAGWPRAWLAVGLIGGWLYGFVLARMHEETMRGTPGADWAREVKPPSGASPQ